MEKQRVLKTKQLKIKVSVEEVCPLECILLPVVHMFHCFTDKQMVITEYTGWTSSNLHQSFDKEEIQYGTSCTAKS